MELRKMIAGTYVSTDKNALSITFSYPNYRLNPMKGRVWAAGTNGTWEIYTEHKNLTSPNSSGYCVLEMSPPDDRTITFPMNIVLKYDTTGVSQMTFSSFLGIDLPKNNHMKMIRE